MDNDVLSGTTVKDPVCGMDVVPGKARGWDYLYEKEVYHFCGPDCRIRFQSNPKKVLDSGPGPLLPSAAPVFRERETAWASSFQERIREWVKRFF